MSLMKGNKLSKAIMLGIVMMSASAPMAYAQDNEKVDKEDVERISVLGSRIKKATFESASPITVVSAETLAATGLTNLADALAELPQLGIGSNLNNTTNGTTSASLRGAGASRTLTLINGKRVVASTISGTTVDLSGIPIGMVEQVEILTGGASAIYGSDALAGVINIKLKKGYDGFKFSAKTTIPELGAGETQQFSLTAGGTFNEGKGSITAGVNYTNSNPIYQVDRDFVSGKGYMSSVTNPLNAQNPDINGSQDGIPDVLLVRDLKTGPYVDTGGLRTWNWDTGEYDNFYLNDAGEFVKNERTFYGYYTEGGPGFDFAEYGFQVQSAQEAKSAMINLDYDVSDDIALYSTLHISKTVTDTHGQPSYTEASVPVYIDNPTLPVSVRDWMIDNGKDNLLGSNYDSVLRTFEDFGRQNSSISRDLMSLVIGFNGVYNDWDWDVSYQRGQSSMTSRSQNRIYKDRLALAFDAVEDEAGNAVCRASLSDVEAVRLSANGCIPLAIFGNNTDQAAIDWVSTTAQSTNANIQTIVSGYISGALFQLPAGPVNVVFGSEYREETIEQAPDAIENIGGLVLSGKSAPIDPVSLDVSEVFTEVDIPIMDNMTANASYRYSDYSSIGSVDAWGIGLDYQVIEDLKFRISASSSVKAPSVYDLNNPGSEAYVSVTDICRADQQTSGDKPEIRKVNCLAEVGSADWDDPRRTETKTVRLAGNPNLKPEEAKTLTTGLVISPSAIDNLNVSIDWWKIELTNEIKSLSASEILQQCYDTVGLDGDACKAITRRESDNAIEGIVGGRVNLGFTTYEGIDYEFDYKFNANELISSLGGEFTASLLINQWLQLDALPDPEKPSSYIDYKGGTFYPDFRGTLTLGYQNDDWRASLTTTYRASTLVDPDFDHSAANYDEVYPEGNGVIPSIVRVHFNAGYQLSDRTHLSFGIRNITNAEPPRKTSTFWGQNGVADIIGRTYQLGIVVEL